MVPIWLRVVLGVALVVYIVWDVRRRWFAASAASEAMGVAAEQAKRDDVALRNHPGFARLWQHLVSRFPMAQGPSLPGHRIRLVQGAGATGTVASHDPSLRYITALLQGASDPRHLSVSIDLATGQIHEQPVSAFQFDAMVPVGL